VFIQFLKGNVSERRGQCLSPLTAPAHYDAAGITFLGIIAFRSCRSGGGETRESVNIAGITAKEKLLFRMGYDGELVHPVHQRVAFLDNAFEFAPYAGDQFVACQQVAGIDRHLLSLQEIGLDPVFLEFNPVDEPALFEFLDYAGALAAVYAELFPEFALEHALRLGLDKFQCLFFSISHDRSPPPKSDYRCYCQDVVPADDNHAKAPAPLVVHEFNGLFHVDVQVFVHGDKAALEFAPLVLDLHGYLGINKSKHFLYRQNNSVNHLP
jgi:hypothetical protein